MISKATAKFIKSLQLKKFRQQHESFIVEGAKNVLELISAEHAVKYIVATKDFISTNKKIIQTCEVHEVNDNELQSLGTLKSNNAAIAVAEITKPEEPKWNEIPYVLMLDDINDPGNLGTIIRTADWYGINNIVASPRTTELYNPKVINSTKGSFLRVKVFYNDLSSFILENPKPLIGTFMSGKNVHDFPWPTNGYIVMGSEANGLSNEIEKFINHRITIPGGGAAESLNVAVATSIICDNWFRCRA